MPKYEFPQCDRLDTDAERCAVTGARTYPAWCLLCKRNPEYLDRFVDLTNAGKVVGQAKQRSSTSAARPGTELKSIIAWWQRRFPWFDLSPGKGCDCDATARWMDNLGPDGCMEALDKIVQKLDAEARKRNLSIPFQKHWARKMVKQAIRRARAKAQAANPI